MSEVPLWDGRITTCVDRAIALYGSNHVTLCLSSKAHPAIDVFADLSDFSNVLSQHIHLC